MSYVSSKNGQKSSMRLNFILLTIMSSVLLFSIALYIVIHAIKGNLVTDWSGMGFFALGILGGMTGMGFAKAQQKKHEVLNGNDNK